MNPRHFFAAAILLLASHLSAQTCYPPFVRIAYTAADCPNGYCKPNAPVTFTLINGNTGLPYVLTCETGVSWDFGDGTSGTGVSPTHTYSTTGSFGVMATVSSSPYGTSAWAYVNIANGVISATPSKNPVSEHDGSVSVLVHTTYSPASVSYQVNEAYSSDSRITPATGTLTFAAGEYDKTISIPITDDTIYEGNADIGVGLYSPTGGVMILPGSSNQLITLLEDDPPPILNFSAPKYTFSEAAGNAVVNVNRTGDMSRTVSVYYYVSGSTYQSGTLTFGPNVTTQAITIPIPNDNVWNPDRIWSVSIQSASGGAVLGTPPNYQYYETVPITITDDEPKPALSLSDAVVPEGNSGRKTVNLTLSLSAPLSTYCTVGLTYGGTATRTVDYDASTTYVYFSPGETTKSIPITVIGDTQIEPDETVIVTIASVANGYYYPPMTSVPTIAKGTGTLTIANDDIGMTWLKLASGTSGRMTIYLGNPSVAQDTITLTSSKPDVVKVPTSFVAQSGRTTLDFNVEALTPGTSLITAKFPASLGGGTLTANVDVYTPVTLAVQPQSLSVPVNTTQSVVVTMSPAPTAPVALTVTTTNTSAFSVPASVTVGTNGTGTLNVKGLAVGNGAVTLTLPPENGGFDTMILVSVTAPPNGVFVSQVSPPNGPTAGGTTVTVTGLNFVAPCSIAFGGNAASNVTFVSANSLTATTPAHAAGPVDVSVTCGTDQYTFGNGFTYVAKAPQLSSISPVSGSTTGGTTVAVSGSDLRSSCGVFFGGVAAKVIGDQTPDKFIVTTPAHDAAAVDVTLQCDDGASSKLSSAFAFVPGSEPAAVIGDVDPLAAPAGQTVTINGFRFRPSDTITFADTRAAVVSTLPASHVVVVPAVPPGKVAITLTDSDGHSSTTGPIFSVLEPVTPEITSVTPMRVAPGGEIVIVGKGFRAPYTFALGDKPAGTILDISFNRAVVRIDPAFATGTFTLGVVNGGGVLAAVGPSVEVAPALMASNVAPICASAAGGVDVTLTGSGFTTGTQVSFGSAAATNVRLVDDHTIIATVPQGHIGWPTITIANPNGDSATLTRAFFYYSPFDKDAGCASTRTRGVHH